MLALGEQKPFLGAIRKWINQLRMLHLMALSREFLRDYENVCWQEPLGSECPSLRLEGCGAAYGDDREGGLEAKA